MNNVKRVWKRQSSRIVIRERRDTWNDALKRRAKLHHCGFHLLWSKQSLARDTFCGRQVLLHKHWRQRQHITYVTEPVARVVLRKVIRRMHVNAQQLAHGVVVLSSVQAAHRHVVSDASRSRRGPRLER